MAEPLDEDYSTSTAQPLSLTGLGAIMYLEHRCVLSTFRNDADPCSLSLSKQKCVQLALGSDERIKQVDGCVPGRNEAERTTNAIKQLNRCLIVLVVLFSSNKTSSPVKPDFFCMELVPVIKTRSGNAQINKDKI